MQWCQATLGLTLESFDICHYQLTGCYLSIEEFASPNWGEKGENKSLLLLSSNVTVTPLSAPPPSPLNFSPSSSCCPGLWGRTAVWWHLEPQQSQAAAARVI